MRRPGDGLEEVKPGVRTLLKLSDTCFLGVAATFSAGFFVCVLVQVFYRYVIEAPLPWTEELARYLFVGRRCWPPP